MVQLSRSVVHLKLLQEAAAVEIVLQIQVVMLEQVVEGKTANLL
jgi:hypothetical protein